MPSWLLKYRIAIGIGAAILIILFFAGFYTLGTKSQKEVEISPTPTSAEPPETPISTPATEPTSTPKPTLKPTLKPTATSTPAPTQTPTPTPTPTPVPFSVFKFLIPLFSVTGVTVAVFPTNYTGPCPKQYDFAASITANAAGTVTYKWTRSDDVKGPTKSLTFSGAGSKTVLDSWTLSGGPGSFYSGWEKVQILTPNTLDSNQAKFSHNCET